MIIVLKNNVKKEQAQDLLQKISSQGLGTSIIEGYSTTVIGLVGDTSIIDIDNIMSYDIVDSVKRIQEPYKKVNRKFHPNDSIINVDNKKVGGNCFMVAAGPCSVESEEQIIEIAISAKKSGCNMLRGGAFKPRTSPYVFQGLRAEGIELLLKAKKVTGLPIVTEILSSSHIDLFSDVDLIQIGARNMQNFELLKEIGRSNKPILLKRGLANTIEELLMAAEYIMSGGNQNIIFCERGIRTFETATRNTLDISAVPILKRLSHLPVVVDPSHACGITWLVEPMAKASISAGCDGLLIETHNNPKLALSDGAQSLNLPEFENTMQAIKKQLAFENKIL